MMKVYIVFENLFARFENSEAFIVKVTTDKEKAEKFLEEQAKKHGLCIDTPGFRLFYRLETHNVED